MPFVYLSPKHLKEAITVIEQSGEHEINPLYNAILTYLKSKQGNGRGRARKLCMASHHLDFLFDIVDDEEYPELYSELLFYNKRFRQQTNPVARKFETKEEKDRMFDELQTFSVKFATEVFESYLAAHNGECNRGLNISMKYGSSKAYRARGGINGGTCFIRLFLQSFVEYDKHFYYEYNRIKFDKEIGEFYGSSELRLKALICHEVAHALHLGSWYGLIAFDEETRSMIRSDRAVHGKSWQAIYRELRNKYVNNYL